MAKRAKKRDPKVVIQAQEKKADYGHTSFQCHVLLKDSNISGNCFYTLNKEMSTGTFKPVYKSICASDLNGTINWRFMVTDTDTMAESDPNNNVRFEFYKYDKKGNHKQVHRHDILYGDLVEAAATGQIEQEQTAASKTKGTLVLNQIKMEKKMTFFDYVTGGCEIGLHVNIDFTMSNGQPKNKSSLHYLGPENQYELALNHVGRILESYDSDYKIPVYGFGGKTPDRVKSDCFALNGNMFRPEVVAIDGVIATYRKALS